MQVLVKTCTKQSCILFTARNCTKKLAQEIM